MADKNGEIASILAGIILLAIACTIAVAMTDPIVNKSFMDGVGKLGNSIAGVLTPAKPSTQTLPKTKTMDLAPVAPENKTNIHHIVAQGDWRVQEARTTMLENDVDPKTDPQNLIALPAGFHWHIHSEAYHTYVNNLMSSATSQADVYARLGIIRAKIYESVTRYEVFGFLPSSWDWR